MTFTIRLATPKDAPHIQKLLPRLANFPLPPNRKAEYFYSYDSNLLKKWANNDAPDVFVHVAAKNNQILGATIVSLGKEFFSGGSSAHLEVLVVADGAEGQGIGKALLANAEQASQKRGALTMSLHVVGNNQRARQLYQHVGYDEELIRCIKHFS